MIEDVPTDEQFAEALDWFCAMLAAANDSAATREQWQRLADVDATAVFLTFIVASSALFAMTTSQHAGHDCEYAPAQALATLRVIVESSTNTMASLNEAGLLDDEGPL